MAAAYHNRGLLYQPVEKNLGGFLAILVLLFFLRNVRSTFVIALAIPISIIATFTLVYFSGFTLNLMTLGGLALGVGMMVDNAIVVLENIFRKREQGGEIMEVAVSGAEQVTPAVVASTITTLVIFLPMIFLEGVSGVMFRQLAFVVAFALICSLLVALTLVPTSAARLLGPVCAGRPLATGGLSLRAFEASGLIFRRLEQGYLALLRLALERRGLTLAAVFLVFAGSLLLAPRIGSEFMPASDEGEVRISVEMEVGTRLEADGFGKKIRKVLDKAWAARHCEIEYPTRAKHSKGCGAKPPAYVS